MIIKSFNGLSADSIQNTLLLVYMTNANRTDEIEERVMYSILQKRPKGRPIFTVTC
jgi:hypothetical protein